MKSYLIFQGQRHHFPIQLRTIRFAGSNAKYNLDYVFTDITND